jgi:hypothetical protein
VVRDAVWVDETCQDIGSRYLVAVLLPDARLSQSAS